MLPTEGANMRIDGAIWDGGTSVAVQPTQPSVRTPLRITFRHLAACQAIEARIREHVERLERFHTCITDCHVIVEAPPVRRRRKPSPFNIKIDLTVTGKEISVSSDAAQREAHADVYIALRDAFDTVRRLLRRHQ